MVFKKYCSIAVLAFLLITEQLDAATQTEAQLRAQLSTIDQQLGQQVNKSPRQIQQILNRKKDIQTQLDNLKNQPAQAPVPTPDFKAQDQQPVASPFGALVPTPDFKAQDQQPATDVSSQQPLQQDQAPGDTSQQASPDQSSVQTPDASPPPADASSAGSPAVNVDLGSAALTMVTDVDGTGFVDVMTQLASVFDAGSSQYSIDTIMKVANKAHDLVSAKKLKKIGQAQAYAAMVASGAKAAKEKRQFCNDTMSSLPFIGSGAKLKGWNDDVLKFGQAGPNVNLDINFIIGRLASSYGMAAQRISDLITQGTTLYSRDDIMTALKAALPQNGQQYSPEDKAAMQNLFAKAVATVNLPDNQRPRYQGDAFSDLPLIGQKSALEKMLATVKGSQ